MKRTFKLAAILLGGGCLFAMGLAAFDHPGQIRVESEGDRFKQVRVRTDNYVHLVRQLSGNPCRRGYSWGYDANRIWVDHGCRAIFEYGSYARDRYDEYDPWGRDDRYGRNDPWGRDDRYGRNDPWGRDERYRRGDDWCCTGYGRSGRHDESCRYHHEDDRYGDDYGYGRNVKRIRVESEGGRRKQHYIPVHGDVRLVRQISDARCREGYSWGYNRTGVWVDHGCRAEFLVPTR